MSQGVEGDGVPPMFDVQVERVEGGGVAPMFAPSGFGAASL